MSPAGIPEAYSAGYVAGRAGAPLGDNPHPPEAAGDRTLWRAGWLKAEQDVDDENVERQFREPPPTTPASL